MATKGRAAPDPTPERLEIWTSPDTGRTLQIRKVSTLLRAEMRKQVLGDPDFAEPKPPQSEVDYGDGKVRIANRAHPVYQQLLMEWQVRVQEEMTKRLRAAALDRGVVASEIDVAAVAEVREMMARGGTDLSSYDDRHVYIAFVCVGSEEDWTDLLKVIFQRSAPQEAAVQAHIATFQPDVPGPAIVP